jgi:hypothetical protein
MEQHKRVISSKYPKIVVDDEELEPSEAIDKALEEFDESVKANKKAAEQLGAAVKRHNSQPPAS